MAEKPTNPKDAVGIKKAPMSTVSAPFMLGVGLAMMEGALKYGRHNYREVGVRSSVYYDAAMRHLMAWYEGEDIDPDSGLSHLVKAGACMAVLFDSLTIGNLNDDRPPKHHAGWMQPMNDVAAKLIEKYPNSKPAHTEQNRPRPIGTIVDPEHGVRSAYSKDKLHDGETPAYYNTEEGGFWHEWPTEGRRFGYFAKQYANGDIWDPIAGWR